MIGKLITYLLSLSVVIILVSIGNIDLLTTEDVIKYMSELVIGVIIISTVNILVWSK